jgi:DNA-binding NarL/FixJ family response regulator
MNLLIIDETETVFLGLKHVFNSKDKNLSIHWASSLKEADRYLQSSKVDLIISELCFLGGNGMDFIPYLSKRFKKPLIIHTSKANQHKVNWLRNTCVIANHVFKEEGALFWEELDKIETSKSENSSANSVLSLREQEVMDYLLEGFTNKKIAKLLSISDRTVATYKHRLLKKIGLEGEGELRALHSQSTFSFDLQLVS